MTRVVDIECARLHEFLDGELGDQDAERFRRHLSGCIRCATEMPRVLELMAACDEALVAAKLADAPLPPAALTLPADAAPQSIQCAGARQSPRIAYTATIALTAAAAALVLYLVVYPGPNRSSTRLPAESRPVEVRYVVRREPDPSTLLPAASRPVQVRLSYAGASAYRPYVPRGYLVREEVPFERMAELQRAGDWHGFGVALLLRGDLTLAAEFLGRAQRSLAVDADRAALELLNGSEAGITRALVLLEAVLAAEPEHMAARWNRALALEYLEQPLAAARDFDRVAASAEPGWSEEAAQRALRLRAPWEVHNLGVSGR